MIGKLKLFSLTTFKIFARGAKKQKYVYNRICVQSAKFWCTPHFIRPKSTHRLRP